MGTGRQRTVIVDADACPRGAMEVLRQARRRYGFRLVTVASFRHALGDDPDVDEHVMTGDEPQAADMAVANRVRPGDIVVTQDWGLASLVLGRQGCALSPSGRVFDPKFIQFLEEERALKARVRRGGGRVKGPKARTAEDDARFERALQQLLEGEGEAPGGGAKAELKRRAPDEKAHDEKANGEKDWG